MDKDTFRGRIARRIAPGTRIDGYEVIRPLGRGAAGEVLLARDTRLGRLVALKLLARRGRDNTARFLQEARATATLSHENIVVIHGLGEHEGAPYMVLEYLKGRTLRQWIDERLGPSEGDPPGVSARRAAELMIPVARALVCAHERGIVHRDLKPSNIMLTDAGTIKVLDLGVVKLLGVEAERLRDPAIKSGPDTLAGTGPYMSPEQWNAEPVDHRADLWSMGVILAELVLGRHPLAPLSMLALASIGARETPMPSVHAARPDLGELGVLIDRCLQKRREDRLASARELLDALSAPEAPASVSSEDEGPYPGLPAFRERDAGRFWGRGRAVAEALSRLADQPLVTVVGPSGCGKSSFVRAGVIPALRRSGEGWEAVVIRPGRRPLVALAELLSAEQVNTARMERTLRVEPGLLGVELRARAKRKEGRILLVVDQLEELFTLAPDQDRAAFFACLGAVADDASSRLRVMPALRSDCLDRISEEHAASIDLGRGLMLLPPMDRAGLREALVRPLSAAGYRFDPESLADELLDTLAHTAGALPLLSLTAAALWEKRDRDRRALTREAYLRMGGVAGVLAAHADSVLGAMTAEERPLAREALLRAVTPARTRAVSTLTELRALSAAPAVMDRVIAKLVDARLLTVEQRAEGEATVELVHELLITGWPALGRWVEARDGRRRVILVAALLAALVVVGVAIAAWHAH